jgi:hypothetical protein
MTRVLSWPKTNPAMTKRTPQSRDTLLFYDKSELCVHCAGVGAGEYASKELQQLVSERKCPAYILPTRNLLGRSPALQQITTVQYILYWPPSKGKNI